MTLGHNTLRIFVCANHIGSALQNRAFIDYCINSKSNAVFYVLSSKIAARAFKGIPYPVKIVDNSLVKKVRQVFREFKPHFSLIGLSFDKKNIDDIALKLSGELKIPNGVIQDYWGYLGNFTINFLPQYFFVIDETAKDLTQKRTLNKARCVVTGSPKHEMYGRLRWISGERTEPGKVKKITYFGQPRSIPGVLDNLELFVAALGRIAGPILVQFKIHPLDIEHVNFYRQIFKKQPHRFRILQGEGKVELLLWRSDLSVTAFSTAGLDHNYLQFYSKKPLGNLLYLLVGKKIRDFFYKHVGMDDIPGAVRGMGRTVKSKRSLVAEIKKGLYDKNVNRKYMSSVERNLQQKNSPSAAVLQCIKMAVIAKFNN